MRPATIRRLLVFGVCTLGVSALYLVPGVAGTPDQSTGTRGTGDSDPAPKPVAYDARLDRGGPADQRVRTSAAGSGALSSAEAGTGPTGTGSTGTGPTGTGATGTDGADAADQASGLGAARAGQPGTRPHERNAADEEAPSAVSDLTFPTVTAERLTVSWAPASDNVGVTGYRVWLNGYHVADTTALHVAIPWFKDGSRDQVVQVRAVDAAGNQSEQAPARLVERPVPVPTAPEGSSEPTPAPKQTPAGSAATATSRPGPGGQPTASASATPTTAPQAGSERVAPDQTDGLE